MTTFSKAIGNAIKRRRQAESIHQRELADISGLSENTISNVERGRNMSLDALDKICRALEIDELVVMTKKGETVI